MRQVARGEKIFNGTCRIRAGLIRLMYIDLRDAK
jgi:hypothetical protein